MSEPKQDPVDSALAAIEKADTADDLDRIMGHAETLGMTAEQINTIAEAAGQRAADLGIDAEEEQ